MTPTIPPRACRFRHPARVPDTCRVCRAYAALEARCRVSPEGDPGPAPGTGLAALIRSLGLHGESGCGCESLASQMNAWGVEGCEARREEILAHLRGRAARLGWLDKLKAGALAVTQGLVVNPLDPASSLLDEALRRASAGVERAGASPVELSTRGGE